MNNTKMQQINTNIIGNMVGRNVDAIRANEKRGSEVLLCIKDTDLV